MIAQIVVEGLDRSGKTTQCARLVDRLNDHNAEHGGCTLIKFPERTTAIGQMIDGYLRSGVDLDDHAVHLLFSANRWELRARILEELGRGKHVVLDRYVYSGVAFTMIKGIDEAWCKGCDAGLPKPDLTLFLDLSEEVAAKRGGYGEERYEKAETQKKVRGAFANLRSSDTEGSEWRVIDAAGSVDQVTIEIWRQVEQALVRTGTDKDIGILTW